VRHAVLGALAALGAAYESYDASATMTGTDLSSIIRRWLGGQTFAVRTGAPGIRLLDAQAARFADVDEAQLLGLVEGEWPEPSRRNIFYPPSLLGLLDPAPAADDPNRRESEARAAARAAFVDLMRLPRAVVRGSAFSLEFDAIAEPSPFVDDIAALGLAIEAAPATDSTLVFADEALMAEPPLLDHVPELARAWAGARRGRPAPGDRRYLGESGPWSMPRISVSRVDRYLKCPFQFFASEVLGLEEEPEDADLPPPWERGRFLHAIFETFFREWQRRGHRQITPPDVPQARTLLEEICEGALANLPAHEAALERPRLYGSAASAGIIDRVLAMEAERPATIQQRLVEFELDAVSAFRASPTDTRLVPLRAKIDRVDLLAGGTFRVIDYKSKIVPDPRRSVQLQVYTSAIRQQLDRAGDPRQPAEAFYLSFEGDTPVKGLRPAKGQALDDVLADAEQRMVQALDDIAAGHFPARPSPPSLCAHCPFDAVCRKQFVEPDDA
jgi:RecB family exonuclease